MKLLFTLQNCAKTLLLLALAAAFSHAYYYYGHSGSYYNGDYAANYQTHSNDYAYYGANQYAYSGAYGGNAIYYTYSSSYYGIGGYDNSISSNNFASVSSRCNLQNYYNDGVCSHNGWPDASAGQVSYNANVYSTPTPTPNQYTSTQYYAPIPYPYFGIPQPYQIVFAETKPAYAIQSISPNPPYTLSHSSYYPPYFIAQAVALYPPAPYATPAPYSNAPATARSNSYYNKGAPASTYSNTPYGTTAAAIASSSASYYSPADEERTSTVSHSPTNAVSLSSSAPTTSYNEYYGENNYLSASDYYFSRGAKPWLWGENYWHSAPTDETQPPATSSTFPPAFFNGFYAKNSVEQYKVYGQNQPPQASLDYPSPTPKPVSQKQAEGRKQFGIRITHAGGFSPSSFYASAGDQVTFRASTDSLGHGHSLTIKEFGVSELVSATDPGLPQEISFQIPLGTKRAFAITCGQCNQIHSSTGGAQMLGWLKVE